jgi:hypothetical protein
MSPSGNGGRVGECILSAASLARRAALNHVADHAAKLAQSETVNESQTTFFSDLISSVANSDKKEEKMSVEQ